MDKNEPQKDDSQKDVIRLAVEVASKTTLEVYAKEKQKEKRMRADRRLRDTKRLLRNYREIKIHVGDAIAALADVANEDYEFFQSIIDDRIEVSAIVRSKARSAIMLDHIDAMLKDYQIICNSSPKPEDQRRYRVLEARYLSEEQLPIHEIAKQENIDIRTVYKDIDAACEKMSALLFGLLFIDRD